MRCPYCGNTIHDIQSDIKLLIEIKTHTVTVGLLFRKNKLIESEYVVNGRNLRDEEIVKVKEMLCSGLVEQTSYSHWAWKGGHEHQYTLEITAKGTDVLKHNMDASNLVDTP